MREITDSDQLFNGLETSERAVILSEDDARLIQDAMIAYNQKLVAEGSKVWENDEISDFVRQAASDHYNKTVEAFSDFHVKLVDVFPGLTQR